MSKATIKALRLEELETLRTALHAGRLDAERAKELQRQREQQQKRERGLFSTAVGPVVALRKAASPQPPKPRPAPLARQRALDEARVLKESISDDFDVESLLDTDDSLSYRRAEIGPDVVRKLRRGVWAIQAQTDLHGLRRDAAREQLVGFVHEAAQSGHRCVRIVHGKGNGSPGRESVLKAKVKGWLVQCKEVIAFTQARPAEGGQGAIVVLLGASIGA